MNGVAKSRSDIERHERKDEAAEFRMGDALGPSGVVVHEARQGRGAESGVSAHLSIVQGSGSSSSEQEPGISDSDLLQRGLHALRTGALSEAERHYRELLARDPRNAEALHYLGLTLIRRGSRAGGISLVREAIGTRPEYVEAYSNLGIALLQQGDHDEAIAAFERAIALRPQFAGAHVNLGKALKRQGKLDEAAAAFQHAIELRNDCPEALLGLGTVLKDQGRIDEAIATLRQAVVGDPECPEPYLSLGVALQNAGRLHDAIATYRQIIAIRPDFTELHFNLGVALQRIGQLDEAIAAFRLAIAVKSDYPEAHFNLGNALRERGKLDAAVAAYHQAIAIRPGFAEAQFNLGLTLQKQNNFDQAIAAYYKALELKPDYIEAYSNLGNVLKDRGKLEDAIAAYRKAIAIRPDQAELYFNLGIGLQRQNKIDEAIAAYRDAISRNSSLASAHNNLGPLLMQKGKREEAIAAYRCAIAAKPDYPEAYTNLGVALSEEGNHDEAIGAHLQAVALRPDYADAYSNLGLAFREKNKIDEAVAAYRQAINIRPNYAEAYSNLGNALREQGRIDEAIAAYRQAVILKPTYPGGLFNLSLSLLSKGELDEGWQAYEWRLKGGTKELKPRRFERPQWLGENISGKTLLLHAEQGLGDALQFARFVPLVAALCRRVVLEVHAPLVRLFRSLSGSAVIVVARGAPLPSYDVQLSLMSVPAVLRINEPMIPAQVPYLSAEPERVADWRERLPREGFKIGIAWQGKPNGKIDKGRSFPLRCFLPVGRLPGARLISLQKNHGLDQLDGLDAITVETLGPEFDAGSDAFLDTAGVMENLDLVITSDTSIAHLAGALGRPVWILLRHMPDWRWQVEREDSPWYPTARLFRQRRAGDWDEVFARVAAELERVLAGERGRLRPVRTDAVSLSSSPAQGSTEPAIPVAFGELIDKITILQIKAERLTDSGKQQNVRHELELLLAARRSLATSAVGLDELCLELKHVNELLWDVEDQIRECERDGEFGPRFVELARSVYKTNDRRSDLKRRINHLVNSAIVEEKSYESY